MIPIRVLIADDHSLVRAGMRLLLQSISGIEVVGEASNGREALEQVRLLHPNVALIDISMPELNGLDAARQIAKENSTRVIILSVHENEEYVWEALQAGAAGYILKAAIPAELEIGVKAVAAGETYLSPGISKVVLSDYTRRFAKTRDHHPLTGRQREILQLIAEGHSAKQIASILSLSIKTVNTHRAQLMNRIGVHDVAGLVRYALRIGIIQP